VCVGRTFLSAAFDFLVGRGRDHYRYAIAADSRGPRQSLFAIWAPDKFFTIS